MAWYTLYIVTKHFKKYSIINFFSINTLKKFFIDIDMIRFKKETNNKDILKPYPNDEKRPLSEIGKS